MNKRIVTLIIILLFSIISSEIYAGTNIFKDRFVLTHSAGISHLDLEISSPNNTCNTLEYLDNEIGKVLSFPVPTASYRVYKNLYLAFDLKVAPINFNRREYVKKVRDRYYSNYLIEDIDSSHSDFFTIYYQFGISYKLSYRKFAILPKLAYGKLELITPGGNATFKKKFSNEKRLYYWKSSSYHIPHLISLSTQFDYRLKKNISISIILSRSFGKFENSDYSIKIEDFYGNILKENMEVSGGCSSFSTAELGLNYWF